MIRLLLSLFLISSCSTVHFKSSNGSQVSFDYELAQEKEVALEVEKQFFMWGNVPAKHELLVDKIFKSNGFNKVTDLRIEEVATTRKAAWMLATFGMYYPQTFRLIGKVSN